MLITVERDEDMPGVIAQLQVINQLWEARSALHPIHEFVRCHTVRANERYL